MKNKKEDLLKEFDKGTLFKKIKHEYWACSDCMTKAGGAFPEGHVCTVIQGKCEVCESPEDQTLIPWVDFDWNHIETKHLRD